MKERIALFDLDNTLTDRRKSISAYAREFVQDFTTLVQAWSAEELAAEIALADNGGYVPIGSLHDSVYIAIATHLEGLLPESTGITRSCIEDHWRDCFPSCAVEMAGATGLISQLYNADVRIGIVSNGAKRSRLGTVAALPFAESIDFVLSSEEALVKKPAAAIYHLAMELAGASPDQCWFIGDHPNNDVLGALSVGMQSIWLAGYHSWPDAVDPPKYKAESLAEVGEILQL